MTISLYNRVENTVVISIIFLIFLQCFPKPSSLGLLKVRIVWDKVNPLPVDKILDRSNLKQSADVNFKFDENSRKFSKQAENTVGKGELARYEQFLFFSQGFQKVCFLEASKVVIVLEWVKELKYKPFPQVKYKRKENNKSKIQGQKS